MIKKKLLFVFFIGLLLLCTGCAKEPEAEGYQPLEIDKTESPLPYLKITETDGLYVTMQRKLHLGADIHSVSMDEIYTVSNQGDEPVSVPVYYLCIPGSSSEFHWLWNEELIIEQPDESSSYEMELQLQPGETGTLRIQRHGLKLCTEQNGTKKLVAGGLVMVPVSEGSMLPGEIELLFSFQHISAAERTIYLDGELLTEEQMQRGITLDGKREYYLQVEK